MERGVAPLLSPSPPPLSLGFGPPSAIPSLVFGTVPLSTVLQRAHVVVVAAVAVSFLSLPLSYVRVLREAPGK
jgi:hypothetical protein